MPCFKDINGKNWPVHITVGSLKRVKNMTDVDLIAADQKLFETLAEDPITLVNVLYAAVKPEADSAGVTDDQFGEALAGDALFDATEALMESLCDFFPQPAKRALMKKAMGKFRKLEAMTISTIDKKLDDPQLEEKLLLELQELLDEPIAFGLRSTG